MGNQHSPKKGTAPGFRLISSRQTVGWTKMPLGTEVNLSPCRPHYVKRGPSFPPPAKGAPQPPLFGPCLLWPRSPISATAELLLCIYSVNGSNQRKRQVTCLTKFEISSTTLAWLLLGLLLFCIFSFQFVSAFQRRSPIPIRTAP